jgi:hypothetical protein
MFRPCSTELYNAVARRCLCAAELQNTAVFWNAMLCRWAIVPDVSKDRDAVTCKAYSNINCLILYVTSPRSLETTRRHISEDARRVQSSKTNQLVQNIIKETVRESWSLKNYFPSIGDRTL